MKNKKPKPIYRTRNWNQFNTPLINRGSLTLWFDTQSLVQWLNHSLSGRRGCSNKYSDAAILCCLTLREAFHLPLRQTQGSVCSISRMLRIGLDAPHYSILSRPARKLKVKLGAHPENIKHLVFYASGLKVFGEGEWKVRLDKQVESRVENVYGDGAFDSRDCYRAIHKCGARAIIPPREGSTTWGDEYLADRNSNVGGVEELGEKEWEKKIGYHGRSLVETAFLRLKLIFSERLRSRTEDRQTTEAMIRRAALNKMTEVGLPDGYRL